VDVFSFVKARAEVAIPAGAEEGIDLVTIVQMPACTLTLAQEGAWWLSSAGSPGIAMLRGYRARSGTDVLERQNYTVV